MAQFRTGENLTRPARAASQGRPRPVQAGREAAVESPAARLQGRLATAMKGGGAQLAAQGWEEF